MLTVGGAAGTYISDRHDSRKQGLQRLLESAPARIPCPPPCALMTRICLERVPLPRQRDSPPSLGCSQKQGMRASNSTSHIESTFMAQNKQASAHGCHPMSVL